MMAGSRNFGRQRNRTLGEDNNRPLGLPGTGYLGVADPDPGSGAFLTPGFGIRNRGFFWIPDPKLKKDSNFCYTF